MPPVANPNPYLTSNWPDRSKVKVTKSFNEPGIRGVGRGGGNIRISMIRTRETDLTPYSTYDLTYTTGTYTTFGLGDASYSLKEIVFSGRYGLMPVGIGTDEYVIKRLWSPVLYNATSPSTTLPKLFYNTSDINASLGTGWKWYLQSRSKYSAISQSTMEAWYSSTVGAGAIDFDLTKDDKLETNPDKNGNLEIPGVGTVNVGNLSSKDPFAIPGIIIGVITTTLLGQGYTQAQIDEYFKTRVLPTRPGNKNGPRPPTSNSSKNPVISLVDYGEATVSVRTNNGYSSIPPRTPETRPFIIQRFTDTDGNPVERKFIFPYTPQTISYTPGGSEWNEIPRSTDSPLVEWNAWSLTKVQMSFIVAGTRIETNGKINTEVPDGINVDVEDDLQMLRAMATLPLPVTIFGLDSIFDLQLRQASVTAVPSEWAISDLSITAKRRTNTTPSLISVAQVSLSLIEYPIEKQSLYRLPKLKIPGAPPPPTTPGGGTPGNPDLWSPILQDSVWGSIVAPTPTVTE